MTTLLSCHIRRMLELVLHPARREAADSLHVARQRWSRAWPLVWFAWVAVLSLRASWKREFHTKGSLHVPGHVLIFAVSAFVACRSARSVSQRVIRCGAVIGFGCALEALQSWIFGSQFEWNDVVTDACGVLLALLFLTCADSMQRNRLSRMTHPGVGRCQRR
jgi:peptidoglycan/LPS O-acetylase OafA/YrhL